MTGSESSSSVTKAVWMLTMGSVKFCPSCKRVLEYKGPSTKYAGFEMFYCEHEELIFYILVEEAEE